jgi:uncharacterized protein
MTPEALGPPSERVRLRRGRLRGHYGDATIRHVLETGIIAHVGVSTDEGPIVLPMAYGLETEWLFCHGSVANAMLRSAIDQEVCVTVTLLDGLIVGRSPFHNSATYRSVVIRGIARRVEDPSERLRALQLIADHVVPTWDSGRRPTREELARTLVVAVPLREASAKIREGGPLDEPSDLDGPHWGGTIPLKSTFGGAVPAPDLKAGIAVPPSVAKLGGRTAFGRG